MTIVRPKVRHEPAHVTPELPLDIAIRLVEVDRIDARFHMIRLHAYKTKLYARELPVHRAI